MTRELDRRIADRVEPGEGRSRVEFLGSSHAVKNISASGLLVFPYSGASSIGQFLSIAVTLRDGDFDFSFRAEATVVRFEKEALALRFHAISPLGKQKLASYFAAKFTNNLFDVRA